MKPNNIFITGALGFLGKGFVRALLEQEPTMNVFLLVREKGGQSAVERLEALGLGSSRIIPVLGDLLDPGLGELAVALPRMDEVWHLAGLTSFQASKRDELMSINVVGTARVLDLATHLHCRRFHHISTAYVAGGGCPGTVPEDGLLPNPVFRNPYEETKYYGEQLVRTADLPWIIIRPSIIMGHSETGEVDSDKMVYGVVKSYQSLDDWVRRDYRDQGGPPPALRYEVKGNPKATKNLVCTDDVVRLMLLVRTQGRIGSTDHCTHSQPTTIGLLHELITSVLTVNYLDLVPELAPRSDPKQIFIDRGVRVYEPYMMQPDPLFDQTNAYALGDWRPLPMTRERQHFLIGAYVDGLRRRKGPRPEPAATATNTALDPARLSDVREFGNFSLAYETMSRQVEAFRAPGVSGYLAYAVVGRTAMMIGDPVSGQPEALAQAFLAWCQSHHLSFSGLQVRRQTASCLHAMGLAVNKMGIETFMDLKGFDPLLKGAEYEIMRKTRNIARRYDVSFAMRPMDSTNSHEILRVSNNWRHGKKNRAELRLLLREIPVIPEPGVRHCFIQIQERLLGFVFFTPIFQRGRIQGYTAGIERYDLEGTSLPGKFNAMGYTAYKFACIAKHEGIETLALGMSPLYGVENSDFNDNPDLTRLFMRIFDESELYAFQGIARHKRNYPCRREEPVFMATHADTASETVLDVFMGIGLLD